MRISGHLLNELDWNPEGSFKGSRWLPPSPPLYQRNWRRIPQEPLNNLLFHFLRWWRLLSSPSSGGGGAAEAEDAEEEEEAEEAEEITELKLTLRFLFFFIFFRQFLFFSSEVSNKKLEHDQRINRRVSPSKRSSINFNSNVNDSN